MSDPAKPTRRQFGRRVLSAAALGTAAATGAIPPAGSAPVAKAAAEPARPFGDEFPNLDSLAVTGWHDRPAPTDDPKPNPKTGKTPKKAANPPPPMDVPRDRVVAFALYTVDHGVLKLSAQLYPLKPGEAREARLEVKRDDAWVEVLRAPVVYPGWSAHFRIEGWDQTRDTPYRVRHGADATFAGTIRRDPVDKDVVVVANLSCNSSRTTGARPEIVTALLAEDPDVLFFAGDQTYRHTEHTAGWIEFGLQFRDVIKDRPTVCTPDDHDVGHPNLWGEGGKRCKRADGADGGYFYSAAYVNMVQRQQSWHLPDPVDPRPVEQGITVYFTRLRVGGVDLAILEDRKFKSGPDGKIPKMGPRPDHINDPKYDPKTIDVAGLELLGARQMEFLRTWSEDWSGAAVKAVLSQTAFCGAVHMHGGRNARLLADLDCNGWPQTGRLRALEALRRIRAVHLCGDQHLAVVVKHGLTEQGDGPWSFTSPALVNTIYGRWWHPLDEKPGPNPVAGSPLPWTGDFTDGLGNRIRMAAYANPENIADEKKRADGWGLARFDKKRRTVTFECFPRFPDPAKGPRAQFPGWPVTVGFDENDGRKPAAWLPELEFPPGVNPVVQVIRESDDGRPGEVISTVRVPGPRYRPAVFASGNYTIKAGRDRPDKFELKAVPAHADPAAAGSRKVEI